MDAGRWAFSSVDINLSKKGLIGNEIHYFRKPA